MSPPATWLSPNQSKKAAYQFSPHCCDEEASPECCHEEEEWPLHVSPDHPSALHIKEELDQRADPLGPSCRQQSDTTVSPQIAKGEGHTEPSSHLYRILTVEQAADIKAEPDGEEFITSPSTREAEIPSGINPEPSGPQRETLIDPLEITHPEQDGSDEQQFTEQDWNPCQDHEDPDPPQIKVEMFTSSSPQEVTDHDSKLLLLSQRSIYDERHAASPRDDQTVTNQTFYTAQEKRRDTEGEGCRVSQPYYSMNQCEYGERTEDVVNGEWMKALTPTRTRPKKRQNLCSEGREVIGVEEDVNDVTRERRHTCPICGKRFKESGHLKDHVRIHTGEKPYQCKECGMNFRQSGALTLHMRIHTGERPYQCTDCGRRFNRKGDMETHKVTHTGERPHLCIVCGKSYKRKSNLNTHLKIHTRAKMDYTQPL